MVHKKECGSVRPTAEALPLLSLKDVYYSYEGLSAYALQDISLDIYEGEHVLLVGANGSGKSTVARILAGLVAPDKGEVNLFGRRCFAQGSVQRDSYAQARKHIGMVFQEPEDQILGLTVEADIAFGPQNLCYPPQKIASVVKRELKRFDLLDSAHKNPTELSGGQQQKLALASALAMNPDVLILDEAAAHLDMRVRKELSRMVEGLGLTRISVTHDICDMATADKVVVLCKGKICAVTSPQNLLKEPEKLLSWGLRLPFEEDLARALKKAEQQKEQSLQAPVPLPVPPYKTTTHQAQKNARAKSNAEEESATLAAGLFSKIAASKTGAREASIPEASLAVQLQNLSFAYEKHPLLKQVNLSLHAGEICALLGATGSGKTTLMRLMAGLLLDYEGTIDFQGKAPYTATWLLHRRRRRKNLSASVGYVMQAPERQLFAETVLEDVMYGPRNLGLSERQATQQAKEALASLGIQHLGALSPFELSLGQARLVALAGIVSMRPSVLLLDEPFSGLDRDAANALTTLFYTLKEEGKTILFSTHDIDTAAALSDTLALLAQGSIVRTGAARDFFAEKRELARYGFSLPHTIERSLQLFGDASTYPKDIEQLAKEILDARAL